MKKALVTLCLGDRLRETFRGAFLPTWKVYCQQHGLELVVLDRPLDESPRARDRSPAWQKCLVHRAPELRDVERIAWVDADVMIAPTAPDIFAAVPVDRIGAVDDHATPSAEEHRLVTERAYNLWTARGIPFHRTGNAREWYAVRGIDADFPQVVQTGVFVYAPRRHADILERAYRDYGNLGDNALNHEMGPLSYEMIKAGRMHWLPAKFNMMWICWELLHYPFLEQPQLLPGRLPLTVKRKLVEYLRQPCVRTAFRNNHFLHFSGGSKYYRYL